MKRRKPKPDPYRMLKTREVVGSEEQRAAILANVAEVWQAHCKDLAAMDPDAPVCAGDFATMHETLGFFILAGTEVLKGRLDAVQNALAGQIALLDILTERQADLDPDWATALDILKREVAGTITSAEADALRDEHRQRMRGPKPRKH